MPSNYTPTATNHATITLPSDGDARTATSVRTPLQQLADLVAGGGIRIPKAWGFVETGASGPTIRNGTGNFTASYDGSDLKITLGTALANNYAAVVVTIHANNNKLLGQGIVDTTTEIRIGCYDVATDGAIVDLSTQQRFIAFVLYGT